jgi:Na+-transporting methylmalonyl-CoA/oxaloacetate decarboxylase beta subunit
MFMIDNLFRESGVVPRLSNAASNEILNIATIFLMITIGAQWPAERVFDHEYFKSVPSIMSSTQLEGGALWRLS